MVLGQKNTLGHHYKSGKTGEHDQEIQQLNTADQPTAPRGRATEHLVSSESQLKQNNQLALPHQDNCKTRRSHISE